MTEEHTPPASTGGQEPLGSGSPAAAGQEPVADANPPAGQVPARGDGPSREELHKQLKAAQAHARRLEKDLADERLDAGRHRVANKSLQEQVDELRTKIDSSDERARTAELRAALIPRLGDPTRVDLALKVIRDDPSFVDDAGAVKVRELLEKYPALAPSSAVGPANPPGRGSEPDLSQALATHDATTIRKAFYDALDKEGQARDARRASTSQGS